jgi:hypothetical protein
MSAAAVRRLHHEVWPLSFVHCRGRFCCWPGRVCVDCGAGGSVQAGSREHDMERYQRRGDVLRLSGKSSLSCDGVSAVFSLVEHWENN